jgi:probable O-glycosylation ligase (exosortase A-associated)
MRELLLIAIVAAICVMSLIRPRIGFYGYLWFALMRPDELAFSTLPFFGAIAICTLVGSMRLGNRFSHLLRSPIIATLLVLQLMIGLSVLFAVKPDACFPYYTLYVKVIVMSLLVPLFVIDEITLRRSFLLISLSLGFIAAKFAIFSIVNGGVMYYNGYGRGMMADNNGLAMAMGMLLPMAWYSRLLTQRKWARMIFTGIAGAAVLTVILTGSRGNSIAMACVILLLVLRSRRRVLALVGIIVLALPALVLVGDRYMTRLATLGDVEADASVTNRFDLGWAAVHMWQDHKLFGVGFGQDNFVLLSAKYLGYENKGLVVHNTYLQLLVDSGIFAFVIYTGLVIGTVIWLGASARTMKGIHPDLVVYPRALQAGLLHFAIASVAYSRNYFELFYILLTLAAAWQLIAKELCTDAREKPEEVDESPELAPGGLIANA